MVNFAKRLFKGDKILLIMVIALMFISLLVIFSSTGRLAYNEQGGNTWHYVLRQLMLCASGLVIMWGMKFFSWRWLYQNVGILLLVAAALVGLAAFGGQNINGAGRWIRIPLIGITFQPSEIAKMAVFIVTAYILSKGQSENGASPKAFKQILIITGIVCALILPENYSTGMLLFATVYLMMFIGRVPVRKLLLLGGSIAVCVAVFVAFLLATPNETLKNIPMGHRFTTWKGRILDFTNRQEVPAAKFDIDDDAQVGHARIAVASSNVIGKGPGNSVQRDFLSQAFSDFIYAIIIEELGLAGGVIVVFLYIWLLIRAGKIAQQCDRTFPAFLVLGIGLLLTVQALFNMMVAVGLAPVTGQPLPLISRGGTSTLINCVYIGMLLSVSRYTARLREQQLHDARIPLTIEGGGQPEDSPLPADSEAQTAAEPTAQALNSDDEFK